MQVVTALDNRRPSAILQEKIRDCVAIFRSLNETVNEVIELGQKEGFTPKEIGQFIREEMLKSGLSRRTVTRYLPSELKAKPRGISKQIRDKMSQNQNLDQSQGQIQSNQRTSSTVRDKMSQNQSQSIITANDIEQFSMTDRHLYTPEYLGKVIDHLAKVYNEKTGQKIQVIFRKAIENGDKKYKKYQPSPDEVRQREDKVLSLVNEGMRILELVEQSGISESSVRRYLQKAGYRITAGTISSQSMR